MQDTDPAAAFFPGVDPADIDLYAVLALQRTASASDIKSAYRRLALLHHPDKVQQSTSDETRTPEEAHAKFQQIGFAYVVLKDETRRKRYDESGRTDEGSGDGARTEAEWKDYFRELWSGEVSGESIDEFTKKYQGSDEEKQDLFLAYTTFSGSLDKILPTIMCSTVEDEERFVKLIDEAITSGELKSTPAWKKSSKDLKAREKRKTKASKEAKEAEEYAKELGVHDKLYGDGVKGKGKGKGRAKGGAGGNDEDALRALIQGNQAKRMDAMVASLEEKYGGGASKKGGKAKKRASTGGDDDDEQASSGKRQKKKEVEPTEEEFAKIQAEMDARRASKGKKGK